MVLADAALVFAERHVEDPVQIVLHAPMGAYRRGDANGFGQQRRDEEPRLGRDLAGQFDGLKGRVVVVFRLGGRDVADRFQQALVVEPIDPFECLLLHGLQGLPWPEPVDDLGL